MLIIRSIVLTFLINRYVCLHEIFNDSLYSDTINKLDDDTVKYKEYSKKILLGISHECRKIYSYFLYDSKITRFYKTKNYFSNLKLKIYETIIEEEMELLKKCNMSNSELVTVFDNDLYSDMNSESSFFNSKFDNGRIIKNGNLAINNASIDFESNYTSYIKNLSNNESNGTDNTTLYLNASNDYDTNIKRLLAVNLNFDNLELKSSTLNNRNDNSFKNPKFNDYSFNDNSIGKILITSLHHARELLSLYSALNIWDHLLQTITKDKQDNLLKNKIFVMIPFVNPDGFEAIAREKNFLIRKNKRKTCLKSWRSGVDLNRNYDVDFQNINSPCDFEEYEGPHSFSEPETRAVKRLVDAFIPQVAINFHSYGNVWTKPWNCCKNKTLNDSDETIYQEIQQKANIETMERSSNLDSLGYEAKGEASDWMYKTHHVIAMSAEIGHPKYGFYPPFNQIDHICNDVYDKFKSILSFLDDIIEVCNDQKSITISNLSLITMPISSISVWYKQMKVHNFFPDSQLNMKGKIRLDLEGEFSKLCFTTYGKLNFCFENKNFDEKYCEKYHDTLFQLE